MSDRRSFSLPATLLFGAFLLVASSAHAQWTVLKTFSSQIESIYFLDQEGSVSTGFVGLENSTIWRTTDNGVSWNQATTPSTVFPSNITQFAFRNALQGWCSVRNQFNQAGGIWETTDGGVTWTSNFGVGGFVSIGFCATSNILSASDWATNAYQSTNFGVIWTPFAPDWQNGVTFSGLDGFMGNLQAPNPLFTTDGGVTWNPAPSLNAETWSPYAIPGTSIVVAAAEKSRQFFISRNGGALWTNPYTFPSAIPTGCIMGTTTSLIVQSTNDGFFWSTDTGNTWTNICGPSDNRDTRFYSVGSQIFAADVGGDLWYLSSASLGATVTVQLDRTSLTFSGIRCLTLDSAIHIRSSNGCVSGVLTKAQIISGANTFSLQGIPTILSGNDSIGVLYTPSPSLKDSGKLLLEFNLGTKVVDTIITLYGTARNDASVIVDPYLQFSTPYACMTADSEVIIRNSACDTLFVTGESLSDTTHFQLLPFNVPRAVAPGSSDTVWLTASSRKNGNFLSELELRMLGGGSIAIKDSVPLTFKVLQGAHAIIDPLHLTALDECVSIDTVVSIFATPCDSIFLLGASLSDTSVFHLAVISYPVVIPASGSIALTVHGVPGKKGISSTILHVRYLSGTETIDTTITLSLQVLYDLPVQIGVRDTLVSMGQVNAPCASASQWITFSNSLCRDLTIENMTWENADSEFSFDPLSFPISLSSDSGIDSVLIHFRPNTADTLSNRLRITMELNGTKVDTEITIAGIGVSQFYDSLLTPELSFDTILACRSETLIGKIVNLTCHDVVATSAVLFNGINYSVISPPLPKTLASGDTLLLNIQLQPAETAFVTDSARITILDPVDGKIYTQTIGMNGYIVPDTHRLDLNSAAFSMAGIAPCSSADSTIILTNKGNCDDIYITDTTIAGASGVSFVLPTGLPITIPPDSSISIAFYVAPNADTLVKSQFSLHGPNIDTVIIFNYASLPGANALAFSRPDSIFTTKPCIPIPKTFWIANVGCQATSIDTIALTNPLNGTQYSISGIPALPSTLPPGDTLFYTVQFDPNGSGDGNALLNVRSKEASYNRSIPLSGSAFGIIPTARISLESSDRSAQSSGYAHDTTNVALVLLDDIGDTTGLETISFTLNVNQDLLTLTKLVPAAGWSIADTVRNPNGSLQLRMRHDGGGAVAAGTEIVNYYFAIAVTDSAGCDISMSGLRFNDSSSTYDGCTLASIELSGTVGFSIIDTCGTPQLRSLLNGQVAFQIVSLRPNPVALSGGTAHVELCIVLAHAGEVAIALSDMLGREVWRTTVPCASGIQTLQLELPNIPEGSGFITVSNGGMQDSRNVIFESGIGKN